MEARVDPVKVLYAIGVLLGVAAAFYFGFQLLEDLSPTTTSAVLLLAFVAFLFAGLYTAAESLSTVFYALAGGSYLVFVFYTVSAFDLSDGGIFLLLAGSSALFIVLGYAYSEGRLDVERTKAAAGIGVALLLVVALLGLDVTGAQPEYTTDIYDEAVVPDTPGETAVGELTAENPFLLSRTADPPTYEACLYTPEMEVVPVRHDGRFGILLSGGESRSFELTVGAARFYDRDTQELYEGLRGLETLDVESADECPEATEEVKLVVVPRGGATPARPP